MTTHYYTSTFKESIFNNNYYNFMNSLKIFIWDNEKKILYDENLKKLDSTQLLFFWIKITINCDNSINNFINKYNVNNNYRLEIKNLFQNFINELNILF